MVKKKRLGYRTKRALSWLNIWLIDIMFKARG